MTGKRKRRGRVKTKARTKARRRKMLRNRKPRGRRRGRRRRNRLLLKSPTRKVAKCRRSRRNLKYNPRIRARF